MSIDFEKKEGREGYLKEKLDDLLEGINASYGQSLLEELMSRLDATISEFNDEVNGLMSALKENSEKKESLLKQIKSGQVEESESKETSDSSKEPTPKEISEWEKRLENLNQ